MKTLYKAFHRGEVLHPLSHEICAIYDPRDGRIVHVHETMRWPGSSDSGRHDFEARSLEMAAEHGHEVSRLKTMRLDPATLDPTKHYKLDPKSLRRIEIRRPIVPVRVPPKKKQTPASKKRAASTGRKTRSTKSAKRRR